MLFIYLLGRPLVGNSVLGHSVVAVETTFWGLGGAGEGACSLTGMVLEEKAVCWGCSASGRGDSVIIVIVTWVLGGVNIERSQGTRD